MRQEVRLDLLFKLLKARLVVRGTSRSCNHCNLPRYNTHCFQLTLTPRELRSRSFPVGWVIWFTTTKRDLSLKQMTHGSQKTEKCCLPANKDSVSRLCHLKRVGNSICIFHCTCSEVQSMLNVIPSLSSIIATPCFSMIWTARFDGIFESAKATLGVTSRSEPSTISSSLSLLCCFKLDTISIKIK